METKTLNFVLFVDVPGEFFLSVNPTEVHIYQGETAVFTLMVTNASGPYPVHLLSFSLAGLPVGCTHEFDNNLFPPSVHPFNPGEVRLTIRTADNVAVGTYPLTATVTKN